MPHQYNSRVSPTPSHGHGTRSGRAAPSCFTARRHQSRSNGWWTVPDRPRRAGPSAERDCARCTVRVGRVGRTALRAAEEPAAPPWEDEPPPPDDAPPEAFDGPRIEPREPSPFEPEPVALAERQAATEALAARILSRLNPEQQRAVRPTDGPVLILAGAGSGKTRVLAHRVAYLVGVKGVRPWQILAVTFTNKAAAELRARITGLVGEEAGREVAMGTFHALCARVLRRDGSAIGLDSAFRGLRLGRSAGADEADPARRGPAGHRRVQAERNPWLQSRGPRTRCSTPTSSRQNAHTHREREIARLFRRYQVATEVGRRARFRRPAARGRPAVPRRARGPGAIPGPLAISPRRRVPGHEPAAIPLGEGPGRRPLTTSASSATTTSRSTRGAAQISATSSISRATTPTPPS